LNINQNNCINGQVMTIKDFDHHFVNFYRHELNESNIKTLYIPYYVALILAYVHDFIMLLLFKLFGIAIGNPIEQFGLLAVQTGCNEHTWDCTKSINLLGNYSIISKDVAVKRTRDYIKKKKKYQIL